MIIRQLANLAAPRGLVQRLQGRPVLPMIFLCRGCFPPEFYGAVCRVLWYKNRSQGSTCPSGVVAVLTAERSGRNGVGIILKDEPVLVTDKIRRSGDALALVAAEDRQNAAAALEN